MKRLRLILFQSTHLLRGATAGIWRYQLVVPYFNPRTSYEVRRPGFRYVAPTQEFQSTHLLRGATRSSNLMGRSRRFQSTHLLRGATIYRKYVALFQAISIHAPLTRCDVKSSRLRQRTFISIHAPLTRCDTRTLRRVTSIEYFNPRTSYEVRLKVSNSDIPSETFQSTHLLRGATQSPHDSGNHIVDFNPRTSYEVRHLAKYWLVDIYKFQSTHLLRGATRGRHDCGGHHGISIHAPLTRCDGCGQGACSLSIYFNPRTSYEVRPGTLRRRG